MEEQHMEGLRQPKVDFGGISCMVSFCLRRVRWDDDVE